MDCMHIKLSAASNNQEYLPAIWAAFKQITQPKRCKKKTEIFQEAGLGQSVDCNNWRNDKFKKEYVAYMYDTEEEENFLLFEEGTSSINQFINLTYYCS